MQNPFIIPAEIAAKVDEIMTASRARFGHDAFRMEDAPEGDAGAGAAKAAADAAASAAATKAAEDKAAADAAAGSDALGDAGKKALDAMKAKWKDAEAKAKTEADARAALQAKLDGKEAEHAAAQAKAETEKVALAKANGRILRSEVKAAAKGVLADPADAYKFLDLDSFEVSEDGEVDDAAIAAALKDLLTKKPYLAAQGGKYGDPDNGTRNENQKSIDDQIAEATKAGNHALAIALKRQKAYAAT